MSAPANQPLRVAECTGCGQLFAVYETAGEVACPTCATANSVESLEVAELQVANSVPMEVKAPEPTPAPEPAPEPITPVSFSIEPTAAESEPVATDPAAAEPKKERPPTVAEWLVRSESETPAAEAPEPNPEPNPEPATDLAPELRPKPSLSQSLGWNPGGFRLDNAEPAPTADPTPAAEAPVQEPPSEVPQPVAADSEFKFDFGGTPLHQQPPASPDQDEELADEELAGEPAESMGLDLEAGDEAPGSSVYDWVQSEEPARRGWFGPLTAAAGLLAVAAPLAYFGWDSFGEGVVSASDNRAERASLADVMSDEEPPIPWEGADESDSLPAEPATAEPRLVDTATEPASFEVADDEAAGFDSMPEQNTPPPANTVAQSDTPPADPFNAPLPAATEPNAYNPPAGDRYAASQASADVPIDTFDETVRLPAEQPAEPLRPVPRNSAPRRQVGLANAPTYSVGELNAAIGTAIPAGQGFALGTMSDPEQVKSMGQHYAQLCYLAQTLTLFDPNSTDPSRMTAELEAADVFKRLFLEAQPREESRQIAGPWIAWTGRPHGGVFFVGKPTGMDMPGEVVQYNFQLGESTVPVLMAEKLDINRFMTAGAKEIGVIGVVVENPRQWIVGYEGDAERVVWARKTLPLREPKPL